MINIIKTNKRLLIRWLIANFLAWPIGLFIAIILSYTVVNIFHPEETNLILGLGIGFSVGISQWFVLKKYLKISKWWMIIPCIFIGIPFAILIMMEENGNTLPVLFNIDEAGQILFFFTAGVLTGIFQIIVFKGTLSNSYSWIILSGIAWAASLAYNQILLSGIIMGLITGFGLIILIRKKVILTS